MIYDRPTVRVLLLLLLAGVAAASPLEGKWYFHLAEGILPPLRLLHGEQEVTTLSHVFPPPLEIGRMWSRVRNCRPFN